jgi:hypothetical protein
LPDVWLKPAQKNLTSLTIHSYDFWGYMPKADLRSAHFPDLRVLELANFAFTHDWKLDWILSHAKTLEELILDDCPTISYVYNYGEMDHEKYPEDPRNDYGDDHMWEYPRTWS